MICSLMMIVWIPTFQGRVQLQVYEAKSLLERLVPGLDLLVLELYLLLLELDLLVLDLNLLLRARSKIFIMWEVKLTGLYCARSCFEPPL